MSNPPLQRFGERARNDPFFLGALLAAYQEPRRWDDGALAAFLECDVSGIHRLAACRAPAAAPPQFQNEVRAIATFAGCSPEKLAVLVREVTVVSTIRKEGEAAEQQYLLAARDRKANQESQHGEEHGPSSDRE
jgi:hypothetical protein